MQDNADNIDNADILNNNFRIQTTCMLQTGHGPWTSSTRKPSLPSKGTFTILAYFLFLDFPTVFPRIISF